MRQPLHQLLVPCLAAVVALGAAPRPAGADARHVLERAFPGGSTSGVAVSLDAGLVGCGPGVATRCRTPGELRVEVPPGRALATGDAGRIRLAVPAGLSIAGGTLRLALRTARAPVVVRVTGTAAGGTVLLARIHAPDATTRDVALPAGLSAVQVALALEAPLGAKDVLVDGANAVRLASARLVLGDAAPPRASAVGALVGTAWLRGPACADLAGDDAAGGVAGLGIRRLEARIGTTVVAASAAAATADPFRPRPARLAVHVCPDLPRLAGDGERLLVLRAWDGVEADGNAAEPVVVPVRLDATAPVVAIDAPAESGAQAPAIAVRASDATSGVAATALAIDGTAVPLAAGSGAARLPSPLGWGAHLLRAEARDRAGNVAVASATLVVADRVAPTIDGLRPAAGAALPAGGAVHVAARLADAGTGIDPDGLAVALDTVDRSAGAELGEDGVVSLEAGVLAAGRHRVRLVVHDRAGNRAVAAWSFDVGADPVDALAPALTALAPASGARLAAPVRIGLRVAERGASGLDPRSLVVGVDGVVRADAELGADGVVSLPPLPLAAGAHAVRVRVADRAGNAAEAAWTFTVVAGPQPAVRLRARRTLVRRVDGAARVALVGTVVPARAATVAIEVRRSGRFRLLGRVRADASGRFAASLRATRAGAYVLRARTVAATSRPVRVRVR